MQIELNYKSILKLSVAPMTPLYLGGRNSKFSAKWLGVAAELSYNPYLRNGWVPIDTGVKGAVGTPLIEFSTWEAEDSTYNIVIPNSLSYRFKFKGESCAARFLTRSSVEANEWWFAESGVGASMNLWDRSVIAGGAAAKKRRFLHKAIKYMNYRFWNFFGGAAWNLTGGITLNINGVAGVRFEDRDARDASSNFLHFQKLTKHRQERIQFSLYERCGAGLPGGVTQASSSFFFAWMLRNVTSVFKTTSNVSSLTTSNAFTYRLSLKHRSFRSIVAELAVLIFCFLEFKASKLSVSFFFTLFKKFIRELVALLVPHGRNCELKYSSVLVRRLFRFVLATRLSAYSFMVLITHAILDFAGQLNIASIGAAAEMQNTLSAYSYKLRQLSVAATVHAGEAEVALNDIFLKNKVTTSDLLASYAKHRGRGLRPFRAKKIFRFKRRRFRFVGRHTKVSLFKKKVSPAEGLTGVFFPYRLNKLRRGLKLPASAGQFTFLFFWSFQFFNLAQLNLKKKKFFFLAMRVAYFFTTFLKFFKFYAFYFKLLRRWDFKDSSLYSNAGGLALNVRLYCAFLFKKFLRLLAAFRTFCSKIFILKWRRSCLISVNKAFQLRRLKFSHLHRPLIEIGRGDFMRNLPMRRNPANLLISSKFLVWSYLGFNALARGNASQTGSLPLSNYLKYLLKLRLTYLKLNIAQVGYRRGDSVSARPQELSPLRALDNLFAREAISAIALGGVSRAHKRLFFANFVKKVGRALGTVRFVRNRYVYFTNNGFLKKISIRVALAFANSCLFRRTLLKTGAHWFGASTLAKKKLSLPGKTHTELTLLGYRGFVANLRSTPSTSRSPIWRARAWRNSSPLRVLLGAFAPFSLMRVKRYLLLWKTLVRASVSNVNLPEVRGVERGWLLARPLMVAGFTSKALALSSVETILSQPLHEGSLSRASTLRARFMTASEILATFYRVNKFDATEDDYRFCGVLRVLNAAAPCLAAPMLYARAGAPIQKDFSLFNGASLPLPQLSRAVVGGAVQYWAAGASCSNFSEVPQRPFFASLWGSWLSLKTSMRGAASLVAELSGNSLFYLSSFFLFIRGYAGVSRRSFACTLIGISHYLRKYIFALNSFSTVKTFSVRAILFSTLVGFYLKTFFLRNFVLKRVATTFVNRALLTVTTGGLRASLSFISVVRLANSFTKAFLSRSTGESRLIALGGSKMGMVSLLLKGELPLQPLFWDNTVVAPLVSRFQISARLRRKIGGRLLNMPVIRRLTALRLMLPMRILRFYRYTRYKLFPSVPRLHTPLNRWSVLRYLRELLRRLKSTMSLNLRSRPKTALNTYNFQVGKFFNGIRGVRPLKLLAHVKRIGLWPRGLRLHPKRARYRKTYEINVARSKKSLVPDKNFKMPPSIFSRENYDSMNLVWDFPRDNYKFARINTRKRVFLWRFVRRQLARFLIFRLRRRLKTRYLRRTFRYRRFLRRRWFRKKLKKSVYKSLLRAFSKLKALTDLRRIYSSGGAVRWVRKRRFYYSPATTYSLLVGRFFSALYSRFLASKLSLRVKFLKTLKLQFLFVIFRSFFKKMVSFFGHFAWIYRFVFGGARAVVLVFGKLGGLLLAPQRVYSLGLSLYWYEPLSVFNSRLMANYMHEDFFPTRIWTDIEVMTACIPDGWNPIDALNDAGRVAYGGQIFDAYPSFLNSFTFGSSLFSLTAPRAELREVIENVNAFGNVIQSFFINCGFKLWFPARRTRNRVIWATRVIAPLKPSRRASVIRLLKKLRLVRSNKIVKKLRLFTVKKSRLKTNSVLYANTPRHASTFLRLRPLYATLFKWNLNATDYRLMRRALGILARAQRNARPSPLYSSTFSDSYSCATKSLSFRKRRPSFFRRKLSSLKRRKFLFKRHVVVQRMREPLKQLRRPVNVFARLPRWKRAKLFNTPRFQRQKPSARRRSAKQTPRAKIVKL